MVISIDSLKNVKPVKSRLFLCKPNRETIAELHDVYGKRIKFASNGIDELIFRVPYKVKRNNEYVRNKHIDKIRGHYLIRYEEGDYKQYFIITKPIKTSDNGISVKDVQCFLLPYELNDKIVRNYKGTKKLYDSVGTDGVLNDTLLRRSDWSIGYIDIDIALKYRTFDVSEKTMLDFMNELLEAFDCIITWDTVNKKINFYKADSLGQDKGLSVEYGKYLKSISEEPDFDNVVTRLYVYGKDGISINKYNPAGTDYLESFAYYMYPFERDENKNVVKHSLYMTDGLCHAILDYQELLTSKQNEFKVLLDNLSVQQATLIQRQNELFTLLTELEVIQDNLFTANATGQPTSELITQRNNKQVQIDDKNAEISNIQNEIVNINNQINTIKSAVAIENNFTHEQIIERDRFIKEKAWSNEHYFNEKELYDEGGKQLLKINQPIIQYKIDVVDFLKVVQCKKDWNKLNKYDIITIKYSELNISIKAKIIEIERDDEGNTINLTIANADDIRNGFIEYKDLIAKFSSSSARVDMSKFKWDETESNINEINQIINNTWDANKRRITAGVNESVEISRKGMTITNVDFPSEMLVANAGIIGISSDFGNSFKNAITTKGIVGEVIFGKLLAGTNLVIDASNEDGQKTFTVDETGVRIKGSALIIEDGLSPDQLDPSFKNSLVELNKSYTNGVRIDTTDGLTVTRSDDKVKSIFNATDGIKIQVKEGSVWKDKFYANTEGQLIADELIANKLIVRNGGDTLIDATTRTIDFSKFNTIAGSITATNINIKGIDVKNNSNQTTFAIDSSGNLTIRGNINITNGSIDWGNVTKPSYTASDVDALATSSPKLTHIDANGIYTGVLSANQIDAGSISADRISGGTISGVKITVTTNLDIGEKLIMGGTVSNREIRFSDGSGGARITTPSSTSLRVSASDVFIDHGNVTIGSSGYATNLRGNVNFTGATVTGLTTNSVTAVFG